MSNTLSANVLYPCVCNLFHVIFKLDLYIIVKMKIFEILSEERKVNVSTFSPRFPQAVRSGNGHIHRRIPP